MEVQAAPADEAHHPDLGMAALIDPPPPARSPAGEVGGPQEVRVLLQPPGDLLPAEGVVAQGDHVGPGGVELIHLPGEDARAGGVLPVDHGEMDVLELLQPTQGFGQMVQSLLPHHVAYGQDAIDHGPAPPCQVC